MNSSLKRGIFVGGLSGLLFGFDTAVIAGTTHGLAQTFDLSPAILGLTVSSALWGTLVGAFTAGMPGDAFGARNCLRAIAILYVVSALGCFFAPDLAVLVAARVLAGLAVGASSVLAPTYLAEIAPAKARGKLVGVFQLNIVVGILVAYFSNYLIGLLDLGPQEWRWKFGITALPALVLAALLYAIPNSPRWLAVKGRIDEARAVLGQIGNADIAGELASYARQHTAAAGEKIRLSWRRHARPITLAVLVAFFNQMSGINAILYYLNDIFAAAGFGKVSSDLQSVIIGATNLVFTVLALSVIDRVGRKTLLLIGSVGLVASLTGVAFIELTGTHQALLLPMLIGFIAAFAFSQGAIIWVYIAEVFPTEVRARGQGLGCSTHWLMDALIATAFPIIAAYSKGLPFVVFAVAMAIQFVVVLKFFPETKGIALEDMELSISR
ncbi:sugar porter family MFS transporter [Novosphingobium sp. FSW06-99]|uniref:sugar porter family MFS transporter n=1 Tax=Novosphingobium sp. FSW06-99 TaxID=1739113 RepID=UPI000AEC7DBE|nr:sugar porter family MFS transporter [Novosphingobium sp. FSW06-99]